MEIPILEELIEYGQILGKKGYTPGISGNLSVRDKEKVYITSSGSANGYLTCDDISEIALDGQYIAGNIKPSSEKGLHLEFYNKRSDINCVFHTHSPYLTAFASAGKALDEPISPEIVYCFNKIPLAKYATPGSEKLVKIVSEFIDNYDVILLENHGVIVGAPSIKDAYLRLELVEEYAKSILFAKFLGGANILSEEDYQKILVLKQ